MNTRVMVMMTGAVIVLLGLSQSIADAAGISVLDWSADSGVRVTGPNGCVHPTYVWQRPYGGYGMYFYDGDGWTFGDTGYATSTNGTDWTYQGRVLTHGGNGFDDIDALIFDIVSLPGGTLRAYCGGMGSNQVPVRTSIFYTETTDPNGVNWPNARHLLFPEEVAMGSPRVFGSAEDGYTMYFYRNQSLIRTTSSDGISWGSQDVVVPNSIESGYDIVSRPEGGYRLFVGVGGSIKSMASSDGITWSWDAGARLTPDVYGQSYIGCPALADIDGDGRMYIQVNPDRGGIRSATAIPEPVTIGLVALGTAVVLRRRRK